MRPRALTAGERPAGMWQPAGFAVPGPLGAARRRPALRPRLQQGYGAAGQPEGLRQAEPTCSAAHLSTSARASSSRSVSRTTRRSRASGLRLTGPPWQPLLFLSPPPPELASSPGSQCASAQPPAAVQLPLPLLRPRGQPAPASSLPSSLDGELSPMRRGSSRGVGVLQSGPAVLAATSHAAPQLQLSRENRVRQGAPLPATGGLAGQYSTGGASSCSQCRPGM